MAIARLGGSVEFSVGQSEDRPAGAHSYNTIVIPSASDFCIIQACYYDADAAGQHPTSVTLDGQAATFIAASESDTGQLMNALYFVTGYSAGSGKTVAWNNPATYESGIKMQGAYFTGGDISSGAASLVRGTSGAQSGTNSATSGSVAANSGDYALVAGFHDGAAPTFSPATAFFTDGPQGFGEYSPTGASTYTSTSSGATSSSVMVAVLIPSGGGGPPTNQYPHSTAQRNRRHTGRFM